MTTITSMEQFTALPIGTRFDVRENHWTRTEKGGQLDGAGDVDSRYFTTALGSGEVTVSDVTAEMPAAPGSTEVTMDGHVYRVGQRMATREDIRLLPVGAEMTSGQSRYRKTATTWERSRGGSLEWMDYSHGLDESSIGSHFQPNVNTLTSLPSGIPGWTLGQPVFGEQFALLPVGSVVFVPHRAESGSVKSADGAWREAPRGGQPIVHPDSTMQRFTGVTLRSLPTVATVLPRAGEALTRAAIAVLPIGSQILVPPAESYGQMERVSPTVWRGASGRDFDHSVVQSYVHCTLVRYGTDTGAALDEYKALVSREMNLYRQQQDGLDSDERQQFENMMSRLGVELADVTEMVQVTVEVNGRTTLHETAVTAAIGGAVNVTDGEPFSWTTTVTVSKPVQSGDCACDAVTNEDVAEALTAAGIRADDFDFDGECMND